MKKARPRSEAENKPDPVKIAATRFAATADGVIFFRHMKVLCGYQLPSAGQDPQTFEVQPNVTLYNDARRSVYLEIRKMIPPQFLAAIELGFDLSQVKQLGKEAEVDNVSTDDL